MLTVYYYGCLSCGVQFLCVNALKLLLLPSEYKWGSKRSLVLIAFHLTLVSAFLSVSTIYPLPPLFFLASFFPLFICFWLPWNIFCLWISHLHLPLLHFLLSNIFFFYTLSSITVWLFGASGEGGGCLGLRYFFACPRQTSSVPTHRLCTLMHFLH